ncbi:MAG: glutamate synthase large subunit [Deltaproteobacteria bacterium]|nr:glutamate synthase large subunit [Deltaproteobacteria bacterium]
MTTERTDLTRGVRPPAVAEGLYSPEHEHDACGVGLIANLEGEKSHDVVSKALQILVNLAHRGACGCDPMTGDGAGILIQLPHDFLVERAGGLGISLPDVEEYGAGLVFLPRLESSRRACMETFEAVIREEGQEFLGWRAVPTNNEVIGYVAKEVEPVIVQIFVGRGKGMKDAAAFERKLYVIRKRMERWARESDLPEKSFFYVPSLSYRTMVYKGLMLAEAVDGFYPDLQDPLLTSGLALVHQRYSTNTFPTWELAHPFRFLCHNGEINTLRGNYNWMRARESMFRSAHFGDDIAKLLPVLTPGGSDSAILDNAIELLYHTGRSLPHAVMMVIPEAWENHETMSDEKKAFYEYHSCLMEPWDGPASIPFTDGKVIGAVLDRNGLRPSRYTVTRDGFVVMASETGVLDIPPENVLKKGRLQPGRMFLVDTEQGRIVEDEELKHDIARRKPYRAWINQSLVKLESLAEPRQVHGTDLETLRTRQQVFGYTLEDLRILMGPMATSGLEPLGSMGSDTPLACLSDKAQLLYNYFQQLFAQVTNPPLDAIREELVTSMGTTIGPEGNLFEESADQCHLLELTKPVLTNRELEKVRGINQGRLRATTLPMLYPVAGGGAALEAAMRALCAAAEKAVDDGSSILILSDRGVSRELAPIPALLATAGVHHHLIRKGKRTRCGLVIESGEPREVHHFCLLFGYGAGAINPYLAFESLDDLIRTKLLSGVDLDTAIAKFIKGAVKGVLKTMSKMGISTLESYRGAQIFEAVGLGQALIDEYFTWTPSRLGGIGLDVVAQECAMRHGFAYPPAEVPENLDLDVGGAYQWRRNGELHLYNPLTIAKLQQATQKHDAKSWDEYARLVNDQSRDLMTLRGLLEFRANGAAIPLEDVEPWTEIVKRFKTGAMSYGSISKEAHETLAIAMNRIGGKSNTGEGGEDPDRFIRDPNGDLRRSAIKQVASARFGVTSEYLVNSDELQIKMAQGAKPGEGGQLPGEKVYPWIAKTRHSTPWVGLISPPPHHDIYSIEDLAQLIHDLKNANHYARVSVKLVSAVGVGTVAAGVSKGKADVVLISGDTGGTGASPQTSIKHAGLPWELGLAETQQTLVLNNLRSRIRVETDGKLLTGRDVAIAALLGAEEFGFSTAPLVTVGCIMMRKCHLNTCPVGVATQDPELRKKFAGKPDHVVNFFSFVAEELRRIMASLGFRTVEEMVGRVDKLKVRDGIDHWKAKHLDLSAILHRPEPRVGVDVRNTMQQDHGIGNATDWKLIDLAEPALERKDEVEIPLNIRNVQRTLGTILSSEITRRHGADGLPDDTITLRCEGSGGQSFMAFGARGVTAVIEGDTNDYFGKGLSGAKLVLYPSRRARFAAEENIICGNVALYGATAGEAYIRGIAGERFCVRNSGAHAVVEGVGDHGCEYMTGGRVVVLGHTGRNFAAGMSGGVAYVLDESRDFWELRCNQEMVEPEALDASDQATVKRLVENHYRYTGSVRAKWVLDHWHDAIGKFVKVMPVGYRRALQKMEMDKALAVEPAVPATASAPYAVIPSA